MFSILLDAKQPPYSTHYNVVNQEEVEDEDGKKKMVTRFIFVGNYGKLVPFAATQGERGFLCCPKKFKSKPEAERFIKQMLKEMGL